MKKMLITLSSFSIIYFNCVNVISCNNTENVTYNYDHLINTKDYISYLPNNPNNNNAQSNDFELIMNSDDFSKMFSIISKNESSSQYNSCDEIENWFTKNDDNDIQNTIQLLNDKEWNDIYNNLKKKNGMIAVSQGYIATLHICKIYKNNNYIWTFSTNTKPFNQIGDNTNTNIKTDLKIEKYFDQSQLITCALPTDKYDKNKIKLLLNYNLLNFINNLFMNGEVLSNNKIEDILNKNNFQYSSYASNKDIVINTIENLINNQCKVRTLLNNHFSNDPITYYDNI